MLPFLFEATPALDPARPNSIPFKNFLNLCPNHLHLTLWP